MPDTSLPSHSVDARTRILDAATRIAAERGVTALTLDSAAREAGVSKGGLLYHFASKEALLSGLLTRLTESIEAEFEAVWTAQPEGRGRTTRALLAWAFDNPEMVCAHHEQAAGIFLAAFHQDPALLDPVRQFFARTRARLMEDGLPPGHGFTVMAACDGLFMADIFQMYELDETQRQEIRRALETLLREPSA
ncbi:TetR/AcrR family transcriptional regulator [Roseococcus sp. YIM B11640]|uniref:TetR/AcrR family transcriptional regulator n=1 Tax=Roseococcus sp. YIM B11640 TaxID=3133973 RepID=UPI003C7CC2DF